MGWSISIFTVVCLLIVIVSIWTQKDRPKNKDIWITVLMVLLSLISIPMSTSLDKKLKKDDERVSTQNIIEYNEYYEIKNGMFLKQSERSGVHFVFKGYTLKEIYLKSGPSETCQVILKEHRFAKNHAWIS